MSDLNSTSDDEFMKAFNESFAQAEDAGMPEEAVDEETETAVDEDTGDEPENSGETAGDGDSVETSDQKEIEANIQDEVDPEDNSSGSEEENTEESNETKDLDYKAQYEKLLKPFKANGKEIAVKDVDEAIALMQMGANYSKKMQGLKPHLKHLRLLEQHGLLDDEKINYLIDLHEKNPDAVNKLVSDAELDPLDFDSDKAGEYKPTSRTMTDNAVEMQEVLEELKDSPNFGRTVAIIGNEWDTSSRKVFQEQPQLIGIINDHMNSGVYDVITEEIDRQRMFGKLKGVSDLDAYKQVGDAIQARGGFDHLFEKSLQRKKVTPVNESASKGKEAKKAAAISRSTNTQVKDDFDPLKLSDDDFIKFFNKAV